MPFFVLFVFFVVAKSCVYFGVLGVLLCGSILRVFRRARCASLCFFVVSSCVSSGAVRFLLRGGWGFAILLGVRWVSHRSLEALCA